ncbi:MAG: hypothetical protein AAGF88_00840 [Pseudomonadota bacterium]
MNDPVRLEIDREVARFDPERLEALCQEKGEAEAENEAAEALRIIGQLLRDIAPDRQNVSDRTMARQLSKLTAAADRIGMSTLARVADDVRHCLAVGDPVALSATLARLYRVGDRSIHAIFDLDDQIV